MLSVTLVLEIRRLLREGELSRRAISRKCGVSRSTVYAIANGECGLDGRMLALKACEQEPRLKRCQECGGLVVQPCVLCRARAYRRRQAELRQLVTALRRETAFPPQVRLHQRGELSTTMARARCPVELPFLPPETPAAGGEAA